SAVEAQAAFETVLAEETAFGAAPVALETFLSRYISALLDPTPTSRPATVETPAVIRAVPQPLVTPIAHQPLPAEAGSHVIEPNPASLVSCALSVNAGTHAIEANPASPASPAVSVKAGSQGIEANPASPAS